MTEVLEQSEIDIMDRQLLRVCIMSDLHGNLPEIEQCDLVLLCGDQVDLNCQGSTHATKKWYLKTFLPWAEALPCDKVIFIAGNHELHFGKRMGWVQNSFSKSNKVTYLEHEYYEYKELKIFGTPYCHKFGNWAFMPSDDLLVDLYEDIPEGLTILMSHDAPYGCSDILLEDCPWCTKEHIGNKPLREIILKKEPLYNCHGHLHSSNRKFETLGNTLVVNCSICTEQYLPLYSPIYINV